MKQNKLISLILISILISNTICQIGLTADYQEKAGKQVYLGKNENVYLYATLLESGSNLDISLYAYTAKSSYNGTAWAGIGFGTTQMSNSDMVICTENNGTRECTDWTGTSDSANKDGTQGISGLTSSKTGLSADYSPYTTLLTWKFTKTISSSHMTKYKAGNLDIISCWGENFNGSNSAEHAYDWQYIISEDGNNKAFRPELVQASTETTEATATTETTETTEATATTETTEATATTETTEATTENTETTTTTETTENNDAQNTETNNTTTDNNTNNNNNNTNTNTDNNNNTDSNNNNNNGNSLLDNLTNTNVDVNAQTNTQTNTNTNNDSNNNNNNNNNNGSGISVDSETTISLNSNTNNNNSSSLKVCFAILLVNLIYIF